MAIHPSPQDWITQWLFTRHLKVPFLLERLAGDGSTRTFFQLSLPEENYVLIQDPEWVQTRDYPSHQSYLLSLGIPVPRFHEIDPKSGFLLMEDFGDTLLQNHTLKFPTEKLNWLTAAITLLADLHGKSYPVPRDLPVATRKFDETKYFDELKFTIEHLHCRFLSLPDLDKGLYDRLNSFCRKIGGFGPDFFCHRDYHTRNLLYSNNAIHMIDFQDARLGPPQYDLASILYDAYLPITPEERAVLIQCYETRLKQYEAFKSVDWSVFNERLLWIAYQRTLKAAGSFASFFTRFQKQTHLPYLIPALNSALTLQNTCASLQTEVESVFNIPKWIEQISKRG